MKKILLLAFLIVSVLMFGQSNIQVFRAGSVDAYSKTQLQTSGQSSIDWGNLKNVPDTVMSMIDSSVMLNVRDFGAVGDGVTDDRDAIVNALNAANSTGKTYVIFPDSVYKIASAIGTITTRGSLKIVSGKGKTIIDASSVIGNYTKLLVFANQSSDLTTISDTINAGQFYVKSDLKVIPNEIIELRSNRPISTASGNYFGELCMVRDTLGDSISVWLPIRYNYSVTGTQIRKFGDNSIEIEGIGIKGNINYTQYGIYVLGYKNAIINNCHVSNCMYSGIMVEYIYGGLLSNNVCVGSYATGLGYPILFSSCEHLKIDNNLCIGGRHGIAGGGAIWSYDITISNNTVKNQLAFGLNTHSQCDLVKIMNNKIYGWGMSLSGKNIICENNIVFATANSQKFMEFYPSFNAEVTPGFFVMRNNNYQVNGRTGTYFAHFKSNKNISFTTIEINGNSSAGDNGIYLQPTTTDTMNVDELLISSNILKATNTALYLGSATAYLRINYANIMDNIMTNNFNILADTLVSANISGNTIRYTKTTASGSGFLLTGNCKFITLTNNVLIGHTTGGFDHIKVQNCENILIKNNTIFKANAYKGIGVANTCKRLDLIGNSFIDCTGVLSLGASATNNQDANY